MKRFGMCVLKVVVAIAAVAVIFFLMQLIYGGSAHVIEAIKLYWNVAKNNVVESIIFYSLFVVALLVIELIVEVATKKKD